MRKHALLGMLLAAAVATACRSTEPAVAQTPIAPTDTVVQVVRLEHVQATDLVATINQLTSEARSSNPGQPCRVVAHAETNSILISAEQARATQILAMIARLDVEPPRH